MKENSNFDIFYSYIRCISENVQKFKKKQCDYY